MKEFCSLGTLCFSSELLRQINVRKVSYPFDWLWTDEKIVIDILQDDFNKFLDKNYYTEVGIKFNERQCGHKYYHENMFFHKNPRNDEDYEYYKRCVERFRQLLKKDDEKIFVIMYSPTSTNHPTEIVELYKNNTDQNFIIEDIKLRVNGIKLELDKLTYNHKLCVIINFVGYEDQSHIVMSENNIDIIVFNTKSHTNGVKFVDDSDNTYFINTMKGIY